MSKTREKIRELQSQRLSLQAQIEQINSEIGKLEELWCAEGVAAWAARNGLSYEDLQNIPCNQDIQDYVYRDFPNEERLFWGKGDYALVSLATIEDALFCHVWRDGKEVSSAWVTRELIIAAFALAGQALGKGR